MESEVTLYKSRTHPKVLFMPFVIQLFLIALHLFFAKVLPDNTGWDFYDSWGSVIVHGIIVFFELWYGVLPILRWHSAMFTLTSQRVKLEWGILYKQSREIDVGRIASISEERGILDRIFGCGTFRFLDVAYTGGHETGGPWNKDPGQGIGVTFKDVPEFSKVRELVDSAKANYRTS